MNVARGGVDALGHQLARSAQRIADIPAWGYLVLVLGVAALKNTVNWTGSLLGAAAEAFPAPESELSANFLALAVYRVTDGRPALVLLISLAVLVSASVLVILMPNPLTGRRVSWRIALLLAVSWPAVTTNLVWLGAWGAFMPVFVVLLVLGRSTPVWAIGAAGMILAHPEQALAASAALLGLSFATEFRLWRTRALVSTLGAAGASALVSVWLAYGGVPSRLTVLPETIASGMRMLAAEGSLGVYAWWSFWWLVIIAAFIVLNRRGRVLLLVFAIGLPAAFAATTLDGTRVYAGVASAAGLAVAAVLTSRIPRCEGEQDSAAAEDVKARESVMVGAALVLFLLMPNLQFMMPGDPVPIPGAYWVGIWENYGAPALWGHG